jgi:V/A-type H+-transporting ATPase subunit I
LLFYLAGLFVMSRLARGQDLGFVDALLILAPLGAILAEVWRETPARGGERALVTFMEGFEAVMGYVSNTLSFLRVAAFSLNHAALAIAVMTLAGMLDTFGHWVAVFVGNVIILVLEGGIVLIQVLRLEYYEGFARFFGGDGRAYRPLTLQAAAGGRPDR